MTTALASKQNHVLHRDTLLAVCTNLGRNLEGRTTDTLRFNLYKRSDIVQRLFPDFQSILLGGVTVVCESSGIACDCSFDTSLAQQRQNFTKAAGLSKI